MRNEYGDGNAEQEEAVRLIVSSACLDMLASYGVHMGGPADGPPVTFTEPELAGFIGFTGPVRGSLVISASSAFFRSTYPASPGTTVTNADLLDWTGEMANQVLGRIKRRFCDRGTSFQAGNPNAIRGRYLVGRTTTGRIFDLVLASGNEALYVCFQIIAPGDLDIFPTRVEPILCMEEGGVMLF
jgi:CheY-specific phosphatase CheX